jgi:hypothetical protein
MLHLAQLLSWKHHRIESRQKTSCIQLFVKVQAIKRSKEPILFNHPAAPRGATKLFFSHCQFLCNNQHWALLIKILAAHALLPTAGFSATETPDTSARFLRLCFQRFCCKLSGMHPLPTVLDWKKEPANMVVSPLDSLHCAWMLPP